jgi:peptide deformylase
MAGDGRAGKMAVRKITYLGDPVLRRRAEEIRQIDDYVRALAEDMLDTVADVPGLGLSAPQVGESVRLVVVRLPASADEDDEADEALPGEGEVEPGEGRAGAEDHVHDHGGDDGAETCECCCAEGDDQAGEDLVLVLINPEVVEADAEQVSHIEGCLSLPTLHGDVTRPGMVVLRAATLDGDEVELEARGLAARVLQHEIDHLDGVVFVDRADPDSLYWLVPDEKEELGYREDPTTPAQVAERFERLYRRRLEREVGSTR